MLALISHQQDVGPLDRASTGAAFGGDGLQVFTFLWLSMAIYFDPVLANKIDPPIVV
jgi:hypothetical protein